MTNSELNRKIERVLSALVEKDSSIRNAHLLAHSDRNGIHLALAKGKPGTDVHPDQPYYTASVGKLFTATLIGMLVEQGLVKFEDRAIDFFDDGLLDGIHMHKGVDYSKDIRVCHLLNHTSGLQDYFSDTPKKTTAMLERIFDEPMKRWNPYEVLSWSKANLKAHFPPGDGFHYSDTGYHILGLIVERASGMPFANALTKHIFAPLGMEQSWLLRYSEPLAPPRYPLARFFGRGKDMTDAESLSTDYAGGGIVSTSGDLLRFMKALAGGDILRKETLERMKNDDARFGIGIRYGYGIMKFTGIPVLFPKRLSVWGNAGSIGAFMFYNDTFDTFVIGSLGRFLYHAQGVRLCLRVLNIISKLDTERR